MPLVAGFCQHFPTSRKADLLILPKYESDFEYFCVGMGLHDETFSVYFVAERWAFCHTMCYIWPLSLLVLSNLSTFSVDMLSNRLGFKNPTNGALDPVTGIRFRISKPFKAKSIQS